MSTPLNYEKIAAGGSFVRERVYLGEDHLLVVSGQYNESYRRLYYSDIQALLRCPTSEALLARCLLGLVMLPLLAMALSLGQEAFWGFMIPIGGLAVLLAWSFWSLGSCTVAIQTPVQLVRLRAVNNVRKARKVERELTRMVEKVQGHLTSEDLQRALYGSQSG